MHDSLRLRKAGVSSGVRGDEKLPRISLVTAVYNGEKYLEQTIRSVLAQNYPNLEYVIVNDGSTDGTAEIIRQYQTHFHCVVEQANKGLYAALNAGFARTTGEILGWINSSDMLHVNGLFVVGTVFGTFSEVEWITGRPTAYSESGITVQVLPVPRWSRYRFLAGANRYIQQESTYWRRSLWEAAGGMMNTRYRAEGDFELWIRFFRRAQLYTVNALIGGWRYHGDSLSHSNIARYDATCDEIVDHELKTMPNAFAARAVAKISRQAEAIPIVSSIWRRIVLRSLYRMPGPDWPPLIEYFGDRWIMR